MTAHGIDLDTPEIREFCRRWRIRGLSVFGSVLRDDFRPESDIDFVAEFEDDDDGDMLDLLRMKEELERIVGRRVDLYDRAGVEASRNRFLKREILRTMESVRAAR